MSLCFTKVFLFFVIAVILILLSFANKIMYAYVNMGMYMHALMDHSFLWYHKCATDGLDDVPTFMISKRLEMPSMCQTLKFIFMKYWKCRYFKTPKYTLFISIHYAKIKIMCLQHCSGITGKRSLGFKL